MNEKVRNAPLGVRAITPRAKQIVYNNWNTCKPVYERLSTPDHVHKVRIGDVPEKNAEFMNATMRNIDKINVDQ